MTIHLKMKIHPKKVWREMKAQDEPVSVSQLQEIFKTDNLTIQRALGILWAAGKVSSKTKRFGKFYHVVWEARDTPPRRKYYGENVRAKEKRREALADQKRAETFGVDDEDLVLLKSDYHK